MKVTKKLTTTTIGEVTPDGNITYTLQDFQGGKESKKAFSKMFKQHRKVFIDSVKTEKVVIHIPDEYLLKSIADGLYIMEVIDSKESEDK